MRHSNLTPRLILAVILAFGIAPLWIFGITMILESLMSTDHSSGSLWVRSDGTPLLAYYTSGRSSVEYMDLSGKPVEVPLGEEPLNFVDLLRVDENPDRAAPPDWQKRIRSFTDTRNQPTYWYLISD